MPVLPASGSITIPYPLEPDIELLRQSGNLSGSLLRPELFPESNCSTCFNESEQNIDEDNVLVHSAAPQWVGLVSQGLVFYTFPVMVAFGVLSGLLNVLVLVRQTNKSSYDAYLIWLIGLGVVLLFCGVTLRLTDYIGHSNTYQYLYGYTRGVKEWAWYSSIWTLVMMSLEKVLATKFRFRGSSGGRRQASAVSAVVCGVCFVSSLPHFFEYEVIETFDYASNQTLSMCQLSAEAKTYEYSTVYYWYIIVLTTIFPLPLLLSMLCFLVWDQLHGHRKAASTDGALAASTKPSLPSSSSSSSIGNGILHRKSFEDDIFHRLSVTLIVLHLLLTTPLSLLNGVNGGLDVPQWTWTQNEFNSVMYPLCEFSFYCYFVTFLPLLFSYSDRFHNTLLRTFCRGRCAAGVKPQKTVKFDIQTIEIEIRC